MATCKRCNRKLEEDEDAQEHVIDEHADVCDDFLQEYIQDSVNDAVDELIEEDED